MTFLAARTCWGLVNIRDSVIVLLCSEEVLVQQGLCRNGQDEDSAFFGSSIVPNWFENNMVISLSL